MDHVIWTGHVEIGVEYRMIFVVVFLTVKFGHFEKGTVFEIIFHFQFDVTQ